MKVFYPLKAEKHRMRDTFSSERSGRKLPKRSLFVTKETLCFLPVKAFSHGTGFLDAPVASRLSVFLNALPIPLATYRLGVFLASIASTMCFDEQVFLKKGSLLYLTPRTQARESLEAQEREVGDKLAGVQALLDSP